MRVMCIESIENIEFGQIYNVVKVYSVPRGDFYQLAEDQVMGYISDLFIPLSDIDETTFDRNYKTELV